jgi:hypothetical protein
MWGTRRSRGAPLICSLVVAAMAVAVAAPSAGAATYSNLAEINMSGGGASSPYPSVIGVPSGGVVIDVDVTIWQISAISPSNIDLLLVSPGGTAVVVMADVQDLPSFPPQAIDLTFDDEAAGLLPATDPPSGTYRPTNLDGFSDPSIPGPYRNALSAFDGSPQGGSWKLYAYNDGTNTTNFGGIDGGWSLELTTLEVAAFAPTSGPAGTTVTLAGTGFTEAKAVKFGGVASTDIHVLTDTTMTATVPPGATTGLVSVVAANATAVGPSDFTVTDRGITSIAPRVGRVGSVVTIEGVGLTGATAVAFDGTPAATFTVVSDERITATVPDGASTGPVSVATPGGTLVGPLPFVVRHRRQVSLEQTGTMGRGEVEATDGFDPCEARVPVKVQRRDDGRWVTVASVRTKRDGSFTVAGLSAGANRALAPKIRKASGDVCLKDSSAVI